MKENDPISEEASKLEDLYDVEELEELPDVGELEELPDVGELQELADQGHAEAQCNLGHMYERRWIKTGNGVTADEEEAVRWFRMAADQGYAGAQASLGVAYVFGEGVAQDYAEAVRWFRMAADQGNATAQTSLGRAYATGEGVIQDYAEAVRWYRMAAEQGYEIAQGCLDRYDSLVFIRNWDLAMIVLLWVAGAAVAWVAWWFVPVIPEIITDPIRRMLVGIPVQVVLGSIVLGVPISLLIVTWRWLSSKDLDATHGSDTT